MLEYQSIGFNILFGHVHSLFRDIFVEILSQESCFSSVNIESYDARER